MKPQHIFLIIFLLLINQANAQLGWKWASGSTSRYESSGLDAETDSLGNIYLTGYSGGDWTYDQQTLTANDRSDILILKLDQSGNLIWQKTLGSDGLDYGISIALDSKLNVYIAGSINDQKQSALIKLDNNGNLIWEKYFPNGYHWENANNILTIANDLIFVVKNDIVQVFDDSGVSVIDNLTNATILSSTKDHLTVASESRVIALDFNNKDEEGFYSVSADIQVPVGITSITGINSTGNSLFLTGTFSGNIYVDESYIFEESTEDQGFLMKLGFNGELVWAKHMGATPHDIAVNDTSVIVCGWYRNFGNFDGNQIGELGLFEEIFLAEYHEKSGQFLDLLYASGPLDNDQAFAVKLTPTDEVLICGSIYDRGGVNFGDILLTTPNSGNIDLFIAKAGIAEVKAKISGKVFKSGNPNWSGIKLHQLENDTAELIYDFKTGEEGLFDLAVYSKGTYYLKADYYDSDFMGSYYENDYLWAGATPILIESDTIINELNINLIELPDLTGSEVISGFILDQDSLPERFIDMILVDNIEGPVAYALSDTIGKYEFHNIPEGSYKILVDTTGLLMDDFHSIDLSKNSRLSGLKTYNYQIKNGKVYKIGSSDVLSNLEDLYKEGLSFSIYPNPCSETLFIHGSGENQSIEKIIIRDMSGKTDLVVEPSTFQVDIKDLTNGLYIIEIESEMESVRFKFLKSTD
ncbi:MAG: T9SS type A sorting domain-containing protein [Cyclobacteriaceae bacterium]